jgi:hypothetical protein
MVKNQIKCRFTSEKEKIKFLQKKVYNYYYSILVNKEISGDIKIPYFLIINQVKSQALELTSKDISDVIKNKRVNECYLKAIN